MSDRLIADLTLHQVDDFFTIGKIPEVQTHPRSRLGGRPLDPVTGGPATQKVDHFIPPYKRYVIVLHCCKIAQ